MSKQAVTSKMGKTTVERIEEYAESQDISRSQAIEELTRKALKVEDKGEIVITDGGNQVENRLDSFEEELREQNQHQNYLNRTLAVTVFWFVVYFTLGLSPVWTAITGVPLVAVLFYLVYKEWS